MSRAHAVLAGMLIACLLCLFLGGCAALPMPFQPANEQYNSNMAEGTFLVLASVDTAQTMHLKPGTDCAYEADPLAAALYGGKNPSSGRVLLTNIVMITAHTMVTSWLDDKVATESAKNDAGQDNNLGPWYVGRTMWHVASIGAELGAVLNNHKRGCRL